MAITLVQIVDAITTTLATAITVQRSQSAGSGELTEGQSRPDLPMLQVWPARSEIVDISSGNTDRSTFGGGIRQQQYVIFVDYYAEKRAHVGQGMQTLIEGIDAIENVLVTQNVQPYFGLAGIQGQPWSWEYVNFQYGDPQLTYVGARFTLTIRVF